MKVPSRDNEERPDVEARSIFRSGFADRIEPVSAMIRRRRRSLQRLRAALPAGLSLILAGPIGSFLRWARHIRSVGKLPMTANCLTARQLLSGATPCSQEHRITGSKKQRPAECTSLLL